MKSKIIRSLILIAALMCVLTAFDLLESPLRAVANVQQLDNSTSSYVLAKVVADNLPQKSVALLGALSLVLIWVQPRRKTILPALGALSLLITGCGPMKVLTPVNIEPNETCWVIPLDGNSLGNQGKFNSVEFLDARKVAAKRIMVDKVRRETGRMPGDYEWMDAVRVIRVDRSLVTREWTDNAASGTSSSSQGIKVITKDSIKLTVGLTVTASINEEDASTYLYYHGERKLADVIDQNVRSFAVAELTRKFAEMNLADAQERQNEIYAALFKDTAVTFKAKGITVQYLGNAEGMHYDDPKIQEGINRSYSAEQDRKTALQEQAAVKVRNETRIMNADAEAQAATKLLAAKEASTLKNHLEILLIEAQARLLMASNWNGHLPANLMPANSPLLMSLGEAQTQQAGK